MRRTLRFLLGTSFAASFVGAQCGNPSPLTRTCQGSTVQTVFYKVTGSCGDPGTISVGVSTAGSCAVNVIEATPVGLPVSGAFNAMSTTYDISKGNWSLAETNNATAGEGQNTGTFLNCTGAPATSTGDITLSCQQQICEIGDSDDVECTTGSTCAVHLAPTSADAGITADVRDATASSFDGAGADAH